MTRRSLIVPPDRPLHELTQLMDVTENALDLSSLAQELLQRTLAITAMASGSIWLRSGNELVSLARHPDQQPSLLSPDPIVMRVVASGQPEFADTRGAEPSHPLSAAVLPLIARGEVIGALALAGGHCDLPPDLLDTIASQVAGALRQAQLAEQVEAQRRQLQALKRQQDELINIISHELKNPMASIKGYADLLLRRSVRNPEDPNRRGLETISEQVVRMTRLLDQLLDISRISTGRLRIERRSVDLAPLVTQAVDEARQTAAQRRLTLEAAAPLRGMFDAPRISQAIGNIIGNAVTYSPDGSGIAVRLRHVAHEAILSVSDQGIGIPIADHERIFEPFFRASNAVYASGMGMGLYVAQQIVTRHDGRVWFESTKGEGSTFYIALPLEAS